MQRLAPTNRTLDRFRIGTWRGDDHVALLSPKPGTMPTPSGIARVLDEVRRRGYRSVLTPALAAGEQQPFHAAGFELQERLHLLRYDLGQTVALTSVAQSAGPTMASGASDRPTIRRGRRRDLSTALHIDALAFEPFWRLNAEGLAEARLATPRSRFRVLTRGPALGYHVTGCAESTGYLQRLAVHPDHIGRGFGAALVQDSLLWSQRRGCTTLFVNTQETNARALSLYLRLGFELEPIGLAVLQFQIGDHA
jgi:ribosomal protein S18 acetylase RimI-like enzyme